MLGFVPQPNLRATLTVTTTGIDRTQLNLRATALAIALQFKKFNDGD
jgi:hypothetical protein